jgi:hypothetical protein
MAGFATRRDERDGLVADTKHQHAGAVGGGTSGGGFRTAGSIGSFGGRPGQTVRQPLMPSRTAARSDDFGPRFAEPAADSHAPREDAGQASVQKAAQGANGKRGDGSPHRQRLKLT